ncbi:MAG: hypothetical protein LBI28_05670 [Treponema sp.]|jgi:hypothetical protein|nr:hypothetical protein [Treponema sp.]
MKKVIIGIICIIILIVACNKNDKKNEARIDLNTTSEIITQDNFENDITETSSANENGNIINLEHLDIDSIKQMFVGDWICYGNISEFHNNGGFERHILETSDGTYGYWEINNDKLIITITHRVEDFGEWYLERKEVYDFSFIDDTLVLTIVEFNMENYIDYSDYTTDGFIRIDVDKEDYSGVFFNNGVFIRLDKGRDNFSDNTTYSNYKWEKHLNYVERFGRNW